MLNGMEFQTVGAAYLKALRPTAVLVNGTYRKLCDADRRVLEVVLRLMKGEGHHHPTCTIILPFITIINNNSLIHWLLAHSGGQLVIKQCNDLLTVLLCNRVSD